LLVKELAQRLVQAQDKAQDRVQDRARGKVQVKGRVKTLAQVQVAQYSLLLLPFQAPLAVPLAHSRPLVRQ
jgi:hypothetical protein